jgi:hypothetical protein
MPHFTFSPCEKSYLEVLYVWLQLIMYKPVWAYVDNQMELIPAQ